MNRRESGWALYFFLAILLVVGMLLSVRVVNAADNIQEQRMAVPITTAWADAGHEDQRPESITVNLKADGQTIDTITLTSAGGWKGSFADQPIYDADGARINYTIEEEPIDRYTASCLQAADIATPQWTITNTYTAAAAPEQDPEYGGLTVSATVSGDKASMTRELTFTVTLDDQTVNGNYGDMTFVNGTSTFVLRHGESKTAANLPAGLTYTVTEAGSEGWTVTVNGGSETSASGKILANQTAAAKFNHAMESPAEDPGGDPNTPVNPGTDQPDSKGTVDNPSITPENPLPRVIIIVRPGSGISQFGANTGTEQISAIGSALGKTEKTSESASIEPEISDSLTVPSLNTAVLIPRNGDDASAAIWIFLSCLAAAIIAMLSLRSQNQRGRGQDPPNMRSKR